MISIVMILLVARPVMANPYWFQVGVFMLGSGANGEQTVTGASVRIRTHVPAAGVPQSQMRTATAFWVGLDFPNDAFIQVGYHCLEATGYPQWFWEYFPPKTASSGSGFSHGSTLEQEQQVGPDGSWHTYMLQSSGDIWYTFVDGVQVGSYNLETADSGGHIPYAFAEVTEVVTTNIVLGPSEFANFSYRDTNNVWHLVTEAFVWMGYGAGSGVLSSGTIFPYGLKVLGVNHWIAGSGFPLTDNYTIIWKGSQVATQSLSTPVPNTSQPILAVIPIRQSSKELL
jgi:hypothetical protein